MLNVSSSAPLYDDQGSNNVILENINKRSISMFGLNQPSSLPTLYNNGQNLSNENLSFEEALKKTTYEFKIILLGTIALRKTAILSKYITDEFDNSHKCTLKAEFKTKKININNLVQAK